jgi:glycosyltransferase involved in cell wall biosynthesis
MTRLSIVVPCFNEEAVLPETCRRLGRVLQNLRDSGLVSNDSGTYFVDDGSRDRTWELIEQASAANARVHGIKLSRNCGHQNALLAGLLHVPGEAVVSIDADLQDEPEAIDAMLRAFREGADVVYGVRQSRDRDTAFKRLSARGFYRLLAAMGVRIVLDHADYRLMSRRAIEALRGYEETNLFLRGIVPALGFRTATVSYERAARFAGESKYPLRRMLAFALQGITSFSAAPLRAITVFGMLVSVVSFLAGVWVIWAHFFAAATVPGWASTLVPIFFLGGIQLLSLGVIGEYVAKIYFETKRRPRYHIDRTT